MKSEMIRKVIAATLLVAMINDIVFPIAAYALTNGPSQPESSGFTPAEVNDMVDLFTGDFKYNIPLFELDGYPVNISYQGGVGMDQEASWVGLGWSLNPGLVNRTMRGIPDDFKGDIIKEANNLKPNRTYLISASNALELAGKDIKKLIPSLDKLGLNLNLYYNTYNRFGISFGASPTLKFGNLRTGLSLSHDSQTGLTVSPNLGLSFLMNKETDSDKNMFGLNASSGFNTRSGLKQLSFGASVNNENKRPYDKNTTGVTLGGGPGGSIPFGLNSYVPGGGIGMKSFGATLKVTLGGEIFTAHPNFAVGATYMQQVLPDEDKNKETAAYGYIFSESAAANDLLDVNREKSLAFNSSMQNLHVASATYDVFSVQGQGIGGIVRPYRNDVGTFHDPSRNVNTNVDLSIGAELGAGLWGRFGADANVLVSHNYNGLWHQQDGNFAKPSASFTRKETGKPYENYYFKAIGELNMVDTNHYKAIQAHKPLRLPLAGMGALAGMTTTSGNSNAFAFVNKRTSDNTRMPRNQAFYFLSVEESANYGLVKQMVSYPENYYANTTPTDVQAKNVHLKPHHIGEIHSVQQDGARYVFGLPVINVKQREVTFNVSGRSQVSGQGQVNYETSDASISNDRGTDNYFSAQELPAYTTSFLLTSVLSPDYYDVTGDGVTDDDIGNFTRFNYTRTTTTGKYKWRAPYGYLKARYNPGLRIDNNDDKGTYTYGERDQWYVHSIESRNFIAEFHISPRSDAVGTAGETGGLPSSIQAHDRSYKLNKIIVFSKADRLVNGSAAVPIKTINFYYDYSLCKQTTAINYSDVNDETHLVVGSVKGGKLTLKRIEILGANSLKGSLSPYKFDYSSYNPTYNELAYDRWGNYKSPESGISNQDFPYVGHIDSATAALYASAWQLTNITTPSGSKIHVTYEADDYAYVGDKKAMSMFRIYGFGFNSTQLSNSDNLYTGNNARRRNYVFIQLPQPCSSTEAFRKQYLDGIERMYFNCRMKVAPSINGNGGFESVSGYASIDIGASGLYNSTHAYIKLKEEKLENSLYKGEINPITLAGLHMTQNSLTKFVTPGTNPNDSGIDQVVMSIVSVVSELIALFQNPYKGWMNRELSRKLDLSKSWIRLHHPTMKKIGGGSRVKEVVMSDSWSSMAGEGINSTYGYTYSYSVHDPVNGRISSGVAAYEPMIGGDENPWRAPVFYSTSEEVLRPRAEYFMETPFGEMFFPSPTVGYSRVEVRNIHAEISRSAQGYTVYEHFTAFDFPVQTYQTDLEVKEENRQNFIAPDKYSRLTASQGYTIVLNDMHGKQKSIKQFAKGADGNDQVTSGTEYYYHTGPGKKLNNRVNILTGRENNFSYEQAVLGEEIEIVLDARRNFDVNRSVRAKFNLDIAQAAILPFILGTIFETTSSDEREYRSASMTKVVQQFGILKATRTYDFGSEVTASNILFDPLTGHVLVKEVENDFRDKQYEVSIPAYRINEFAATTASNIGYTTDLTFTAYKAIDPNGGFQRGDELWLKNSGQSFKGWVSEVEIQYLDMLCKSVLKVVKENGELVQNGTYEVKVLHSGRKNLISGSQYTFVTKQSPFNVAFVDWIKNLSSPIDVLNASHTQYSDKRTPDMYEVKFNSSTVSSQNMRGAEANPFLKGDYGAVPNNSSLRFRENRVYNSHRRTDGYLQNYISPIEVLPFCAENQALAPLQQQWFQHISWGNAYTAGWLINDTITKRDRYGNVLEVKNPLGNYNAALYGFGGRYQLASSTNSKHNQLAYDGFEDYNLPYYNGNLPMRSLDFISNFSKSGTTKRNYSFINTSAVKCTLSTAQVHTGRYSLFVNNNDSVSSSTTFANGNNSFPEGKYHLPSAIDSVITPFVPLTGVNHKIVVSGWLKENRNIVAFGTYNSAKVSVQVGSAVYHILASGPQVNGWQRFEREILIPANTTSINVRLLGGSNGGAFFDDLRIFPVEANMRSFVYDAFTGKLSAILDENNYAAFYEYDANGDLIRVKKETERGIMTINETQKALQKRQ